MVETFDCTNIWLEKGSSGEKVKLLQTHLKDLGYYTYYKGSYLKIDGVFGWYTDWAVRQFQNATKHSDDGKFGPKTCKSLNEKISAKYNINSDLDCSNINISKGSSESSKIKKIQDKLKTLGFYTGLIDGDYGDMTVDAVKKFQTKMNLEVTGSINPLTCNSLKTTTSDKINDNIKVSTTNEIKKTVDPNAVDLKKNIFTEEEANISIDGLYFIASSIEPTTAFNNSEWKKIELTNGKYYYYKGHPAPTEWTVETYLHKSQLNYLRLEFVKMQNRVCKVICDDLLSGNYVISIKYAKSKGYYRKVTFTLVEYLS